MPQPQQVPKWEVSLYGGAVDAGIPLQGIATVPDQNPLFSTVNGNLSRHVPTWFFSYGASIYMQAATQALIPDRITPLDQTVFAASSSRSNGWVAGGRLSRAMNPRAAIEGSFEYGHTRVELLDTARTAIDTTRASYGPAWIALLATDPATFQNVTATATAAIDDGSEYQLVANGTLLINILTKRRNTPYAFIGAGMMRNGGTSPTVTLTGRVTTMLNGTAPIDETDTMTLRYTIDRTVVDVSVGVGIKRMMGDRWGLRADLREQLSSNPLRHVVSGAPASVLTSSIAQQGAAATNKFIAVQYSNIAGSATLSTLNGALTDLVTFKGTGMESRLGLTGGIFWRF